MRNDKERLVKERKQISVDYLKKLISPKRLFHVEHTGNPTKYQILIYESSLLVSVLYVHNLIVA